MFRYAFLSFALFSNVVTAADPVTPPAAPAKLNVIVILADDLGGTDLGCYGNTFHETPHLDQLAEDGVKFTNAYSACTVCSPTRAALLTGQYPARLHLTDWIAGHERPNAKLKIPEWKKSLDPKTFTLAKAFKAAGYATASIGKWHLGDAPPTEYGFDVNIAGTNKGQPPSYFSPYKIPTLKDGPDGEFLSDRLTVDACKWIETNKAKPFFVYLPHFAVHTPLMAKKEVIEKYKKKAEKLGVTKNATYAALLESLDDSIGTLRAKLKELKLDDKTAIVFTSDNGGLLGNAKNPITTNPPYRAGKGSAYEGGVRVPLVIYLPQSFGLGLVDFKDRITMTFDIAPTLIDYCNLTIPADLKMDGKALMSKPMTLEPRPSFLDAVFWHYPHYHPGGATPYTAMRQGDWKLIEFFESGRIEIYNLKDDVGEQKDLAAKAHDAGGPVPTAYWKMLGEMKAWRKSVGAQMPVPNPNFKPNLQAPNGSVMLHSSTAAVVGKTLRYEHQPAKDTLGFWTNKDDYATWEFTVETPGTFTVEILQGCGKGQGGSTAFVKFNEMKLEFVVEDTGGFQAFKARDLGTITVDKPGRYTLELRAMTKAKAAVMDCRQIILKPKK